MKWKARQTSCSPASQQFSAHGLLASNCSFELRWITSCWQSSLKNKVQLTCSEEGWGCPERGGCRHRGNAPSYVPIPCNGPGQRLEGRRTKQWETSTLQRGEQCYLGLESYWILPMIFFTISYMACSSSSIFRQRYLRKIRIPQRVTRPRRIEKK